MLGNLVGCLLLYASWMGFAFRVEQKSGIDIHFAPALVMTAQLLAVFLAGLLNLMNICVWLLFLLGLYLFAQGIYTRRADFFKAFSGVGFLFFALFSVVLFAAMYGKEISGYDDFSHWALIVKQMLEDGRYPNFENMIIFQSYPPGSASFIFYVATIVGTGEHIWLFAQNLLGLACILPVFAFFRGGNRAFALVYAMALANLLMMFNIPAHSLLVDSILPLLGGMCILLVYHITRELRCGTEKTVLWCIPPLAAVILVKNSGILFAAVPVLLLLRHERHHISKAVVAVSVSPWLVLPLWQKHCDMVFSQPEFSKHSMSAEYFLEIFSQKPPEFVAWLARRMVIFSVSGKELYLVLALMAASGILVCVLSGKHLDKVKKLFLFCAVLYLVYELGLLLMYIFSMPADEAYRLAGAERYRRSILMVFIYLTAVCTLSAMSDMELNAKKKSLSAAAILLLLGFWRLDAGGFTHIFQGESHPARDGIEQILREYDVPEGSSCFMCAAPNIYAGAEIHICQYLLESEKVWMSYEADEAELERMCGEYDYLLFLDEENTLARAWADENYPDQKGRAAVDLRKTDK